MGTNIEISIIICTFNRAKSLERTLESIREMAIPQNMVWELIIVDNNSRDKTREIVEKFRVRTDMDVVYVFEEKKGLSNARNSGVRKARGEVIAFTDDDVIVDKHWLANMVKAFDDTNAVCIGGKILPLWERTPPKWLTKDLHGYLALLDLGDEYLKITNHYRLFGANMAVKTDLFEKYGCFNGALGRTSSKLYGGEETEFIRTLIDNEENVYYAPYAVVYHCISEERMKKSYFKRWAYDNGELRGIILGERPFYKNIRVMLFAVMTFAERLGKFVCYQFLKPQNAFKEQLILIHFKVLIVRLLSAKISAMSFAVRRLWRFTREVLTNRNGNVKKDC